MRRPPTSDPRNALRSFLALVLVAGLLAGAPAMADTKGQLESAKRQLAAARAALDRATAVWHDAIVELAMTRNQIEATEADIDRLEQRVAAIERRLQRRAVAAFQNGPAGTIDLLLSSASFTEFSDRLEFLGSVVQDDADLVTEKLVTEEELRRERADLATLSLKQQEDVARLNRAKQAAAERASAFQRQVDELMAKLKEETALRNILGQSVRPGAPIEVCPVAGPNSFVDSFGWPRSGGRSHAGIDLIAAPGVPIVAAHDGTVSRSSSSLGGLQVYVRAPGGTYTFYAHLSGYSSASGFVRAGTVIGYNGSTGNAGIPHLHFEYHPGGGGAVNPYQLLLAVC